ncbi:MAG: 3-ketoacyl-ACP reductase [Planctomycetes bacterium]|nr:3-ketoacyl-ACP reductase [Planctomycetota bacterium]
MSPRSAIVTGAGRGIGRGIALELAKKGWSVVVNYSRSAEGAEHVVKEIEAAGGQAAAIGADVSLADDRAKLVEASLAAFGSIDMLVNNAGITSPNRSLDLLDATEEGYDHLMAVNLKGPFFLTQLVARHMIEAAKDKAGHHLRYIVNISSLSAYAVSVNRSDYCMAKMAMNMMTQIWAARLAEYGVRVYEIRPGIIASDMTAGVKDKYEKLIHEEAMLPIARWGEAADVGKAVAMLGEGSLAYSTGETINVDGGYHIRRL